MRNNENSRKEEYTLATEIMAKELGIKVSPLTLELLSLGKGR